MSEPLSVPTIAPESAELSLAAYRALVEQVQAALFVVREGRFLFVNPKLVELFGYRREDMLASMDPILLTAPEFRDTVRAQTRARVAGVAGHAYEIDCIRKDGSRFSAQVWGVRIQLSGEVADLVTIHDVSAIKRATQIAQQRTQLLTYAEELARIGSAELDVATGGMTLSAGMCNIFGEPVSEAEVTRDWLLSRVPSADRPYVQVISEGVSPGEVCEFQHRIVHVDGSLRTVLHRELAEADEHGNVKRAITILQDITVQHAAEQRLDTLTNSDEITGLPNRTALTQRLDTLVQDARRQDRKIAVLGIEIDRLKLVSESLGYAASDLLLQAVAARLLGKTERDDQLAHFGGGEFALLLVRDVDADEGLARAFATTVVEALMPPFVVGDSEIKVTCGIGIALFPLHGDGPEKLLHQAQAAMYRAHELGANHTCVFSVDMHSKAIAQLAMESALRRALERNEFVLYYQPKVDLLAGNIIGVEALLQWSAAGVPTEDARTEFLRVAEETGLIVPIGEWVLRTACLQALAWQRAGVGSLRMGVNLSARQLQQPEVARRVHAILVETGLDPKLLGFEITESVLMAESAHVGRVLAELKALGIEISLNDFGTGHSSLSYLRTLPIDVVKVDRSFVHDVTAAPQDVSITRAIITMAHSLQMKVLAVGVETEGQLALLIANHCDQMQGHYFSRPIAAEAVEALMREGRQLPEHLLLRRVRQRTLLLVDDEDSIVSALKRLLRRDGYNVVTANSGVQGLQRLAENAVDVIVSDQRMPGMTGVEFLRRAKELYPDTVRIVLSGYTELQSITDAINEGAIYKFLTKPWDDAHLRDHIAEAFTQKEMLDENRRLGSAVIVANHELSAVNERLEKLLSSQREQISREENSLSMAREVLDNIPAAVIGIDLDGMLAFANADAEEVFRHTGPLLGQYARDILPADLLLVWHEADGRYHDIVISGRMCRAVSKVVGGDPRSRGKLLVLTPGSQP
ncbi:EAL domain-containing protein [Rhodoferax sp. WC2427]|uniref:EAL domain-containing protein n=1 Tax=Rhodoferax sp. WC2427 TaxID=3234144 RepID=UPI003466AF4A